MEKKKDLGEKTKEVLKLIAYGLKDEEIAQELGCSYGSIRYHRQRLNDTLGIDKEGAVIYRAMKSGLLK